MGVHKTEEQHLRFAQAVQSGANMRQSLLAAGFSDRQARKGRAAISKRMLKTLKASGIDLISLSKSMTLDDHKHLVLGRLAQNTMDGKDGGTQSAKVLGSQRDLNLFVADIQTGVIVVTQPKDTVGVTLDGDE